MKTQKIYTQHEENKEWASGLAFYKDEIKIMEKRLDEIVSKNTAKDILILVEHFQNQLIIQKDQIAQINHTLNLNNDAINCNINKNCVAVDHRSKEDHALIKEQVKSFVRIFHSLKFDYNTFLKKWM